MEKPVEKGFVYLLGDWDKEGAYKIGVTRGELDKRIKKLQTGNSGEIYLCSSFHTEHPFFIETQLHKFYGHTKIRDEWFHLNDDEVLNFKERCQSYEDIVTVMKDNPFFPKNLK